MRKPKALKAGDHIRVVSPASSLTEADIELGRGFLEEQGYVVSLGSHVFATDGHLAGADAQRAGDLTDAFLDSDVDAVLCSRGGYGCARLLPHIDLDAFAATGKPFAGFSDVTTLHLALNRRGLVTYHTPMLITLGRKREPWVYESMAALLKGENPIPAATPVAKTIVGGEAEGVLTGGCLCLLTDSIGTSNALDCEGKILVIEDVDEYPHRIDAMLTHLLNSGIVQKAAGIVVGEMTRTDEKPEPSMGHWPWRQIVEDRLGPLGIPMVAEFPFGHMANMVSLPLGVRARLNADLGRLETLEPHTA